MPTDYAQAYQQSLDRQDRVEHDIAARNWSLYNNQQQRQADAALQQQEIAGRRHLAQDQYGYNAALQGQEIGAQADQNHARFQHEDELFERHQAGALAELHLQQIQQTKMAQFQAGEEQKRLNQQQDFSDYQQQQQYGQQDKILGQQQDFQAQQEMARQTHETALHHLALQGQEARDELLHRFDTDQLDTQYHHRAAELKQQEQAKQELAVDTHISTGVQKGLLYYPPETIQDMNTLESQRRTVQSSNDLDDNQKQQWDNDHYLPTKKQLLRTAVPKPAVSIDRDTAIDQQYGPDFRKQHPDAPIHTDPKTGMPMVDTKAWSVIQAEKKLQFEQSNPKAEMAIKERQGEFQDRMKESQFEHWDMRRQAHEKERLQLKQKVEKELEAETDTETNENAGWLGNAKRSRTAVERNAEAQRRVDELLPPDMYGNSPEEYRAKHGAGDVQQPPPQGAPQPAPGGQAGPKPGSPEAIEAVKQAARNGSVKAQEALRKQGIPWQ